MLKNHFQKIYILLLNLFIKIKCDTQLLILNNKNVLVVIKETFKLELNFILLCLRRTSWIISTVVTKQVEHNIICFNKLSISNESAILQIDGSWKLEPFLLTDIYIGIYPAASILLFLCTLKLFNKGHPFCRAFVATIEGCPWPRLRGFI